MTYAIILYAVIIALALFVAGCTPEPSDAELGIEPPSESDKADRIIRDLEDTLDNWKPPAQVIEETDETDISEPDVPPLEETYKAPE